MCDGWWAGRHHCYCKIRLRLSRLLLHYGITNSRFCHTFVTLGVNVTHCVQISQKLSPLWCHKFIFFLHFLHYGVAVTHCVQISRKLSPLWSHKIHIAVTLFTLWYRCYSLRSNISKIVTIMVSLNSHFTFTGYIMVSLCRTNQKVQKVAKVSKCIFLIRETTIAYFCHLLQNYSKIKQEKAYMHEFKYYFSLHIVYI